MRDGCGSLIHSLRSSETSVMERLQCIETTCAATIHFTGLLASDSIRQGLRCLTRQSLVRRRPEDDDGPFMHHSQSLYMHDVRVGSRYMHISSIYPVLTCSALRHALYSPEGLES